MFVNFGCTFSCCTFRFWMCKMCQAVKNAFDSVWQLILTFTLRTQMCQTGLLTIKSCLQWVFSLTQWDRKVNALCWVITQNVSDDLPQTLQIFVITVTSRSFRFPLVNAITKRIWMNFAHICFEMMYQEEALFYVRVWSHHNMRRQTMSIPF